MRGFISRVLGLALAFIGFVFALVAPIGAGGTGGSRTLGGSRPGTRARAGTGRGGFINAPIPGSNRTLRVRVRGRTAAASRRRSTPRGRGRARRR